MEVGLLLLRMMLAGVMGVAGVTKLQDRAGSIQAARDFGVPAPLATVVGTYLPIAELLVALALMPVRTAWWGALGSLLLLLAFLAGMGYNLARGQAPECHCFGQLHSEPVSWRSMARNGLLALLASVILVLGRESAGASLIGWASGITHIEGVLLVVSGVLAAMAIGEALVMLVLLKQHGRILLRLETLENGIPATAAARTAAPEVANPPAGLPVGSLAPDFHLADMVGAMQSLEQLRAAGKPVVVIFSDAGCGACNLLLPTLALLQREKANALTLAIVTRGSLALNQAKAREHHIANVLIQADHEVATAYQVRFTPSAILIRPDGTIGSPLVIGSDEIRKLIAVAASGTYIPVPMAPANSAASAPAIPPQFNLPLPESLVRSMNVALTLGDAAPNLRLPDLDGGLHEISEFRGRETLLLFWNPDCGFCQRLVPDLKDWEQQRSPTDPQLVLVTTGSKEANQAMNLNALALRDVEATASTAFGVYGTPTGVLLDAQGKIAAPLAVGGSAIMEKLRVKETVH